jgi:hypothetical protein
MHRTATIDACLHLLRKVEYCAKAYLKIWIIVMQLTWKPEHFAITSSEIIAIQGCLIHRRGTEDAEISQRKEMKEVMIIVTFSPLLSAKPLRPLFLCGELG